MTSDSTNPQSLTVLPGRRNPNSFSEPKSGIWSVSPGVLRTGAEAATGETGGECRRPCCQDAHVRRPKRVQNDSGEATARVPGSREDALRRPRLKESGAAPDARIKRASIKRPSRGFPADSRIALIADNRITPETAGRLCEWETTHASISADSREGMPRSDRGDHARTNTLERPGGVDQSKQTASQSIRRDRSAVGSGESGD